MRSVVTGQAEGDSLFIFLIPKNDAWIVSLKEKHLYINGCKIVSPCCVNAQQWKRAGSTPELPT